MKCLADRKPQPQNKKQEQTAVQWDLDSDEKFTERADLVRIDKCFHRFHTLCLWRDWFMPRKPDTDSYGQAIEYSLSEVKRCPVCRRECSEEEVQYLVKTYEANKEIEDGGYHQ